MKIGQNTQDYHISEVYIEIVFDFVAALRIDTRYYVLEIIYSGVSMQTSSSSGDICGKAGEVNGKQLLYQ